ncbi:MAG: acyl-CoA dehydrogenase family protein, partial [Rhodospirillales bacterium]
MNEEDSIILDAVDQFLERDVRPYVRALEAADEYPQEIADKMAELGLFGATISEDYGGLGLSAATYSKIVERVAAVWMSVSGIFNSHLIMCAAIERFATEEMKSTYLPKCASGELRGSVALTESGCGTDLQAIRTRAKFEGNGYILNGSKMWCTNIIKGNIVA